LFPASLPSGLPQNPNVLLIRTHPNPSPSVANSYHVIPDQFTLFKIMRASAPYYISNS
jgi:hypothetical protein